MNKKKKNFKLKVHINSHEQCCLPWKPYCYHCRRLFAVLSPDDCAPEIPLNMRLFQVSHEGSPEQAFYLDTVFYQSPPYHFHWAKTTSTPCQPKWALVVAVAALLPLHNSLPPLISRQPVEKRAAEVTLHWLRLLMMDCGRQCQPNRAALPEPGGKRAAKCLHIIHRCHLIRRCGIWWTMQRGFKQSPHDEKNRIRSNKSHDLACVGKHAVPEWV